MENEKDFIWDDTLVTDFYEYYHSDVDLSMEEALIRFKEMKYTSSKPILTTEEGDKKYKGDEVWWVEPSSMGNYNMGKFVITGDAIAKYYKYFSTEIAAKGYQLLARLRSLHEQGLKYINEYNK